MNKKALVKIVMMFVTVNLMATAGVIQSIDTEKTCIHVQEGGANDLGCANGYETSANDKGEELKTSVKQMAANGVNTVEEAYIAGLDPNDATSYFRTSITMSNGVPCVDWRPNLNTNTMERVYHVLGKVNIADTKEVWYPADVRHRFFKVTVEIPGEITTTDTPGPIVERADATGISIGILADVLVIDVSGGDKVMSYPTKELTNVDIGNYNCDIYKTDKIVLRKVPSGTYYCQPRDLSAAAEMSSQKLTTHKDYYIGIFPITQRQYERVMGTNPSYFKTNTTGNVAAFRPVEGVMWNKVRGDGPVTEEITAQSPDSFLSRLVMKTGMSGFDLPTEAQCEIAFRADYPEAYGRYWNGKKAVVITTANLGDVAWYDENSSSMPHAVGAKWPNPWGLYDICNVSTHCRDVYIETYNKSYVDTPCADTSYLWGEGRVIRGCGFGGVKTFCCLSFRRCWTSGNGGYGSGFRLIRNCP